MEICVKSREAGKLMAHKGNLKPTEEDSTIQGLLGNYLRFRSANAVVDNKQKHLDEDSLTAFVEGNMSERESTPVLSHLVDCSFCRHVTAELVKLDFAFAGEEISAPAAAMKTEPTSVSDVLNNLLSRIFGSSAEGSAVLAHQEPEKEDEKDDSGGEPEDKKDL
jgi:hypothetical protein